MEKHEIKSKFLAGEMQTIDLLIETEKAFLGFSYIEDNNDNEGRSSTQKYFSFVRSNRLFVNSLWAGRVKHKNDNYDLLTLAEDESPQDFDFLQIKLQSKKVMVYVWFDGQWLLNCTHGLITPEGVKAAGELELYNNIVWGEVLRPKVLI